MEAQLHTSDIIDLHERAGTAKGGGSHDDPTMVARGVVPAARGAWSGSGMRTRFRHRRRRRDAGGRHPNGTLDPGWRPRYFGDLATSREQPLHIIVLLATNDIAPLSTLANDPDSDRLAARTRFVHAQQQAFAKALAPLHEMLTELQNEERCSTAMNCGSSIVSF